MSFGKFELECFQNLRPRFALRYFFNEFSDAMEQIIKMFHQLSK